jgi:hypothetical protein
MQLHNVEFNNLYSAPYFTGVISLKGDWLVWIYGIHWRYEKYITKLTHWSRVLEKLTDSQLVKKFSAFYGTQSFITAFTSACHLSLS